MSGPFKLTRKVSHVDGEHILETSCDRGENHFLPPLGLEKSEQLCVCRLDGSLAATEQRQPGTSLFSLTMPHFWFFFEGVRGGFWGVESEK